MWFITTICLLLLIYYIYAKKQFNYWNKKGVPNLNPINPLGDLINCLTKRKIVFLILKDFYNHFKKLGKKYAGFYFIFGPVLIPIDMELIKSILITDHDHFAERGVSNTDRLKVPLNENVFGSNAKTWKYLKEIFVSILTPTKVKNTYNIIDNYSRKLCEKIGETNNGKSIDIFDLLQRYILDSICSAFYGIEEDNLNKIETPVLRYARQINICSIKNLIKVMFTHGLSNPSNIVHALLSDKEMNIFFQDYTFKLYKMRKESKIKRNDALDVLIKMYEDKNDKFDLINFMSIIFGLLVGSFESSAYTTTYVLYELGKSKQMQDKLRDEINQAKKANGGKLDYDIISNLDFLNRFIFETMRIHPIFAALNRTCTKDYKIPGSSVIIEKGTSVIIPSYAINLDKEFFPNPHQFNPNRFLNNDSMQYILHFSMGPKYCPGRRLGLTLIKMAIVKILTNYEVSLNEKTAPHLTPVAFTRHVLWKYKDEFWLDFKSIV